MNRSQLVDRLESTASTLAGRGFKIRALVVEEPASRGEVEAVEAAIGFALPAAYHDALLNISRHVEFRWSTPDEMEFVEPFRQNFCGDLHWSLAHTAQLINEANSWVNEVFPNANDPYDVVWDSKAAFYDVGNGDYLAFDLAEAQYGSVVYLSHDDGQGHGYVLAVDFADLLERWVPIACTGGEDWQWLPFTAAPTTLLDPHGAVAEKWRELLGLPGSQ